MEKFHIYILRFELVNGVQPEQVMSLLDNNIKFNNASITEQEGRLYMIIEALDRPINFLAFADEVKQAIEAELGRCFIYDPDGKEMTF